MRKTNNNSFSFLDYFPSIDLHGENSLMAPILVKEFIRDNVILKNEKIVIIHGKGTYKVRNSVHQYLKTDKYVVEYKLDNWNDGATVVTLEI